MNPLSWIYLAIPGYFLVGCLVMLTLNEIVDGTVTRREFVGGMVIWPVLAVTAVWALLTHIYARYFS